MFETRGIPFILLDIACLTLAGLPFAILTLQHNPFRRGFFCNDDSIKYPLKDDTITYQLLGGVMIPVTVITMIVGECLSVYLKRIQSKSSFNNSYVACLYKAIGTFLFGAAMSQSLTDIAKYSIGRLRPHFLDVCKPDWKLIDCSGGAYIENFTCTGDQRMSNEGRWVEVSVEPENQDCVITGVRVRLVWGESPFSSLAAEGQVDQGGDCTLCLLLIRRSKLVWREQVTITSGFCSVSLLEVYSVCVCVCVFNRESEIFLSC